MLDALDLYFYTFFTQTALVAGLLDICGCFVRFNNKQMIFILDRILFWSILERSALFKSGACKVVGGRRRWRWRRRMHTGVTWTVVTSLVTLAYWRPALVIPAFASPLVTLGGHWKLFHLAPANNRAALFVVSASLARRQEMIITDAIAEICHSTGPARIHIGALVGAAQTDGRRQRQPPRVIIFRRNRFDFIYAAPLDAFLSSLLAGHPERKICSRPSFSPWSGPQRISSRN